MEVATTLAPELIGNVDPTLEHNVRETFGWTYGASVGLGWYNPFLWLPQTAIMIVMLIMLVMFVGNHPWYIFFGAYILTAIITTFIAKYYLETALSLTGYGPVTNQKS